MRVGQELLLSTIGWAGAWFLRGWMGTLRVHIDADDFSLDPRAGARGNIFCIWHENILVGSYLCRGCRMPVLISRSRDGEYISRIVEQLGFRPIRGSTSRGGAMAALSVLRQEGAANLAITPDGPRGPRRRLHPGAVFLASRTGMKLVATGVAYAHAGRSKSWDRMAFPLPFSRVVVSAGAAIEVPPDADAEALAECGVQFEAAMHRMTERAEERLRQWLESGTCPVLAPAQESSRRQATRQAA
jgi:hypothetical protein